MNLYLQKHNAQKKEQEIDDNFTNIDLQLYRYTNKKFADLQKLPYIENKCHDYNQQLGAYMRKNFEIPPKITKCHIQKWADQIIKKPLIMLYILDNYFFKKLYDYITINKYNMKAFKIFKEIEFKHFIVILKEKMKKMTQIYQECQKQVMRQFKESLKNLNKKLNKQKQTQNQLAQQTRYIIGNLQSICEYSKRIIIYYEENRDNLMNQKYLEVVKQQLLVAYIKDSLLNRWKLLEEVTQKKAIEKYNK